MKMLLQDAASRPGCLLGLLVLFLAAALLLFGGLLVLGTLDLWR